MSMVFSELSVVRRSLCAGAVLTAIAACSVAAPEASTSNPAQPNASEATPAPSTNLRAKLMPIHTMSAAPKITATNAKLIYWGGPVMPTVKIHAIFWNSQVKFQTEMAAFYQGITQTAYFDWLSEYDTPSQHIGRGSFSGSYIDTAAPTTTTITNDDIQKELTRLLDAGLVPENDGVNSLYMFHFPAGVSIQLDANTTSCVQFCAYHNTYVRGGKNVMYGVMPDVSDGACAAGCGTGTPQNNLTAVSSHEMIEAVTDPAVGLAQTNGPPLAWYDTTNGEIGDICVAQDGTVNGLTVQLEWSNAKGACIADKSDCTPKCTGRICGDDGCGGSCGVCGNGQSCAPDGKSCGACTPKCSGKQCGTDGCGGTCGSCSGSDECNPSDGKCCTPKCDGTSCGDDGCGGMCACAAGKTCLAQLGLPICI
jgi:hypothetical protein